MSAYHKNALPVGYELAEYTIESVLGHGGFGITYLAHDKSLGAKVAIKEFLPQDIANRDNRTAILPNPSRDAVRDYQTGLKNFVKEARALARFKHPNIVRVLRFLEANGTAYMVMEYEEGMSLADHLKRHGNKLDEPALMRIFLPVLNGLQAVHQAEMLHLDIKPENIYLRKDGNPMLIDFGSARRAVSSSAMQRVALTHGYAPMEQYPDKGQPGPWTDVYAIAASMYRCICGKKPDDSLERYQAILKYQTDPMLPATKIVKKGFQHSLLECIDWALQVYPKDRPQSAREFQDALLGKNRPSRQNITQPTSISRPPSSASFPRTRVPAPAYLTRKDNSSLAIGFLAAGLMVASLVVVTVVYWSDIKVYWPGANDPVAASPAARAPATSSSPVHTELPPQGLGNAKALPKPAPLAMQYKGPPVSMPSVASNTLTGHQDWVQSVAMAPDGKWLASGSTDKTIKLWVTATGKLLGTLRHGYAVNAMGISADGNWLASAGDDGTVRLWEAKTGAQRGALNGYGYALYAMAFSPDGKLLAAGGKDRTVFIWNVNDGKRLHALDGHTNDIYALAFSPDGKYLASAGMDKTLRIWNVANGQEAMNLSGHKDKVLALAYSPDGKWLASGDAGQAIRIWDAATGTSVRTLTENSAALALAYSPDSRWLAAGYADKTIRLFDATEGSVMQNLSGHQDYVQALAFSPDGTVLVSGGRDKTVRLWRAK
jgi:serine/threonine protein kinase